MAQIIEVQGDPLIQFKKGHVKMKSTTARGLIEKHGLELSIEIYEHISQQVAAIKNVVEKEDLDCEFEVRRSFDVFQDLDEAMKNQDEFQKSLEAGEKWTEHIQSIGSGMAEQVLNPTSFATNVLSST